MRMQSPPSRRGTFAVSNLRGGLLRPLFEATMCIVALCGMAVAQFPPSARREIPPNVKLEESVDARRYFDQYEAYLKDGQWSEAVQLAQRLASEQGDQLLNVTPAGGAAEHGAGHYLCVRELCFQRLVDPKHAPALELYRREVDPAAEKRLRAAALRRDADGLRELVEQFFPSRWTDDALDLLAEWSLQSGDFEAARQAWGMLLPPDAAARRGAPFPWADDAALSAADLHARRMLAAVLAGRWRQADEELHRTLDGGDSFAKRFPDARGAIAGKEGKYVDLLQEWIAAAKAWPPARRGEDWPTFGGGPDRNSRLPDPVDLAGRAWAEPIALAPVRVQPAAIQREFSLRRVAEEGGRPLSYHPVAADGVLYVVQRKPIENGRLCVDQILAFDLETGKPAWGRPDAVVYQTGTMPYFSLRSLAPPRYTLTVRGKRLWASVGRVDLSPGQFAHFPEGKQSSLVCIDLAGQGRLLWQQRLDDPLWEYEGAPLSDGEGVYVGLRQAGAAPTAWVARLDADTGRTTWKRQIVTAETRVQNGESDVSCNLLTLDQETLYYNTNLGAVAALSRRDGRIRWLTTLPRTPEFDLSKPQGFYYRDLTPCIASGDLVFLAPADSPLVYALAASTGRVLWSVELPDVVHLLGAVEDRLVCSGDRIYWIAFDRARPEQQGKVVSWFGDGGPRGYGRGVVAGDVVYWPTQQEIHLFRASTGERRGVIRLFAEPAFRETCGNLIVSRQHLVVAQPDRLVAFHPFSPKVKDEAQRWTQKHPSDPGAWRSLARCEEALGEREAAKTHYRQALAAAAKRPDSPDGAESARRLAALWEQEYSAAAEAGNHDSAAEIAARAAADADLPQSVESPGAVEGVLADPSPRAAAWLLRAVEQTRLAGRREEAAEMGRKLAESAVSERTTVLDAQARAWSLAGWIGRSRDGGASASDIAESEISDSLKILPEKLNEPEMVETLLRRARAAGAGGASLEKLPAALADAGLWGAVAAVASRETADGEAWRAWSAAEQGDLRAARDAWKRRLDRLAREPPTTPVPRWIEDRLAARDSKAEAKGTPVSRTTNEIRRLDARLTASASTSAAASARPLPLWSESAASAPSLEWLPVAAPPFATVETPLPGEVVLAWDRQTDQLVGWDPAAGRRVWERPRSVFWSTAAPPRFTGRTPWGVWIADEAGVSAVDPRSGVRLWRRMLAPPPPAALEAPAVQSLSSGFSSSSAGARKEQDWGARDDREDPLVRVDAAAASPPEPWRIRRVECGSGCLVVQAAPGILVALDAADGEPLWTRRSAGTVGPHWGICGSALALQELPPATAPASEPGKLVVLRLSDGGVASESATARQPWFAPPLPLAEGGVAVRETASRWTAVSAADGRRLWQRNWWADGPEHAPWTVGGGEALLLFFGGQWLQTLDASSGALRWPAPRRLPSRDFSHAAPRAALVGDRLIVAGRNSVEAYRVSDGGLAWSSPLPPEFSAGPNQLVAFADGLLIHPETVPHGGSIPWLRLNPLDGTRLQYEFAPLTAPAGSPLRRQGRTLLLDRLGSLYLGERAAAPPR